jgi:hypothetical protein
VIDWEELPEGYYAVPDPRDGVDEITYWRRKDKGRNKRPSFEAWPLKTHYGPRLTRKDLPEGMTPRTDEGEAFIRDWYENTGFPYRAAILEAIADDPVAAGKRFAEWALRCCMCGKVLTRDDSKVYGIGPECRKGMPKALLDNYFPPQVGKAHARHLAEA